MLQGTIVRLEPLTLEHVPALCDIGLDPELWRYTVSVISSHDDMVEYVNAALAVREAGTGLPFVTVLQENNQVIGSTRFANYEAANLRAEIGWTWIAQPWQRSGANIEAKLLMLRHAFDVLGFNRVEFKTDALNDKSRTALRGIGAVEEGTFRRHMVCANGRIRDSVYYSIIKEEWPAVRAALQQRLNRHTKVEAGT